MNVQHRLDQCASVSLTPDLSALTPKQRAMLPLLIEAAQVMDDLFWQQAHGDRDDLLALLDGAPARYAQINYGPWDRMRGDEPFVEGVGPKPAGANFYPADMTKAEFESAAGSEPALNHPYTMVRRDTAGALRAIPYHEFFGDQVQVAAGKLRAAAQLAEVAGLRRYLTMRVEALLTDDYQPSDIAWLEMKDNLIEVVIGPIETYEDKLFGYKTAYEAYVLVKDREWSRRLARYTDLLLELQESLPVPAAYKRDTPGVEGDLNAYDAVYYAGNCNAGSKIVAINLPNDEEVHVRKGTRSLQIKNAIRAKFEHIIVPTAHVLLAPDQRDAVTFDALFSNVMFHEIAHGLGIKNTVDGAGTVRQALKDRMMPLEECKANTLSLYLVDQLRDWGELHEGALRDNYATFLAALFRSFRFGISGAHSHAKLVQFNFLTEQGGIVREDGLYRVDVARMRAGVRALSERILRLQGDGDYDAVVQFMTEYRQISDELRQDVERINAAGIPIDIVFEQGPAVLGLEV